MRDREYHRILLVFVDGVGLAPASDDNPWTVFPSLRLRDLLGGPLAIEQVQNGRRDLFLGTLDATLGVAGLPQSATGQTALFTGVNAPEWMGRHVTGFPGPRLRALIDRGTILSRAREAGLEATFGNAYTKGYLAAIAEGKARRSVTTCMVEGAGIEFRTMTDLEAGEAVTWDIERDWFGWRGSRAVPSPPDLERIAAADAGRHLAGIASRHDLTVYETFLPDLSGHGRGDFAAEEVVRRIDGLIGGVVDNRTPETTLVLTSDHGNFENASSRTHTRAPVPLLVVGPAAKSLTDLTSLTELTPRLLEILRRS